MRALKAVSRDGLQVIEIHRGHRWGALSARTLSAGTRGPGGFPASLQAEGWSLYSWAQVAPWFALHYPRAAADQELQNTEQGQIIAAADHLVRARNLMAGNDLAAGLAAPISA